MLKGKIKDKSALTVWVEYRDGFEVELRYVPRPEFQKLRKRCSVRKWDPKTHQQVEEVEDTKLWRAMAEGLVVNWKGLTPTVLSAMADMTEYPTVEVPFSVDDCEELLSKCYDFDVWVQSTCTEMALFDAARRAAQGNG